MRPIMGGRPATSIWQDLSPQVWATKLTKHALGVIRTVQELLGPADVATTMIHTPVLRLGAAVCNPLDALLPGRSG